MWRARRLAQFPPALFPPPQEYPATAVQEGFGVTLRFQSPPCTDPSRPVAGTAATTEVLINRKETRAFPTLLYALPIIASAADQATHHAECAEERRPLSNLLLVAAPFCRSSQWQV
jgi:hypothetical protein